MIAVSCAGWVRPAPGPANQVGYGLSPRTSVDEDGQWPGLEQVEPDADEQETYGQADSPGVGSEVNERSHQQAETRKEEVNSLAQVARFIGWPRPRNERAVRSNFMSTPGPEDICVLRTPIATTVSNERRSKPFQDAHTAGRCALAARRRGGKRKVPRVAFFDEFAGAAGASAPQQSLEFASGWRHWIPRGHQVDLECLDPTARPAEWPDTIRTYSFPRNPW